MPVATADPENWIFTQHAVTRAEQRGITQKEILAVVNNPDLTYCQNSHRPGRQIRQRGRYAVVVADRSVITVLFHTPGQCSRVRHRTVAAPTNSAMHA